MMVWLKAMNYEVKAMILKQQIELMREAASDFDAISQELFALAHKLEEAPRYNPANELYALVRNVEINTLRVRSIASRFMPAHSSEDNPAGYSAFCVSIEEEPHWLKITVPAILPGRNGRDNTLFITRPLRNCLTQFQRLTPMERFGECVICIVHQYDVALGKRRVRDYDNIETKRYLDVIEAAMLTNDSGMLCSVLQTSKLGDRDCTEFYIMLPETLPKWAKEHIKRHT